MRWNFGKHLVNLDGDVLDTKEWFEEPIAMLDEIEKALKWFVNLVEKGY